MIWTISRLPQAFAPIMFEFFTPPPPLRHPHKLYPSTTYLENTHLAKPESISLSYAIKHCSFWWHTATGDRRKSKVQIVCNKFPALKQSMLLGLFAFTVYICCLKVNVVFVIFIIFDFFHWIFVFVSVKDNLKC